MGGLAGSVAGSGKARRPRPLRRRQPVLNGQPPGWEAWCDGTSLPNPGRIGIGVVLVDPAGRRHELSRTAGSGCNNAAELEALRAALELAASLGARRLLIHSDSDFAVRHATGSARTTIVTLQATADRIRALFDGFDAVELAWTPRHRNAAADGLARQALGLAPKPPAWPGKPQNRPKP